MPATRTCNAQTANTAACRNTRFDEKTGECLPHRHRPGQSAYAAAAVSAGLAAFAPDESPTPDAAAEAEFTPTHIEVSDSALDSFWTTFGRGVTDTQVDEVWQELDTPARQEATAALVAAIAAGDEAARERAALDTDAPGFDARTAELTAHIDSAADAAAEAGMALADMLETGDFDDEPPSEQVLRDLAVQFLAVEGRTNRVFEEVGHDPDAPAFRAAERAEDAAWFVANEAFEAAGRPNPQVLVR